MEYNYPKIVCIYPQFGTTIKIKFDKTYFIVKDVIDAGSGRQGFIVKEQEGPIVYLDPIFKEGENTYDHSDLYPGIEFIRRFSAKGEYEEGNCNDTNKYIITDNISSIPDKVETIEIKNGFKTTIKIKK